MAANTRDISKSQAERQRRYRERIRRCVRVTPVEVDGDIIDMLVTEGYLDEKKSHDSLSLSKALSDFLKKNRYA